MPKTITNIQDLQKQSYAVNYSPKKLLLRRHVRLWILQYVDPNEVCHFWNSLAVFKRKKNTLTGPANCKKTTRHHAHLSLCAKSRKTNDVKSRKWPKTSIWVIFGRFLGQISPNCKFFWKISFIQIEGHI